jgi:hypothetical protein
MQSVNLKMCIHCIHSKSPEQNYQHQSIVAQNNLKEHISTHIILIEEVKRKYKSVHTTNTVLTMIKHEIHNCSSKTMVPQLASLISSKHYIESISDT